MYKILDIKNDKLIIEDSINEKTFTVNKDALFNNFSLPYVRTAHGSQSDKIDEPYDRCFK